MRKIYDTFIFFNELDLLDLRLNILNDHVDYFVLCEASITHSGLSKPFYFEENKSKYSKFLDKIIHVKIDDIPNDFENLPTIDDPKTFDEKCVQHIHELISQTKLFNKITEPHYGRDFFQKESVKRGLENCNEDDIVLFSDCDEIPSPKIFPKIDKILEQSDVISCSQFNFCYYFNLYNPRPWFGTIFGQYKNLMNKSLNELRRQRECVLTKSGWHFSFMGGAERVKTKLQAYSHQELHSSKFMDTIEENMEKQHDPFSLSNLKKVDLDDSYPEYFLKNLEKYEQFIKND